MCHACTTHSARGIGRPLPERTTMPSCTAYLYDDSRLGCALPIDHDGPHVTGSGHGWHDSDDMDGGVTAALIEKEAERGTRGTATDSALARYWLKEYDRAEARAEKAEKERDEARAGLTRLVRALDLPDTATVGDMIARIEEINAEPRPLTPEVTDEMVARAVERYDGAKAVWEPRRAMREALTAALTEPPARPKGAEELAPVVDEMLTAYWAGDLNGPDAADFLASRGVRVVTEDGAA